MLDEASNILDYLPISRSPVEDDYIKYLWGNFERLATSDDDLAESFSATAFHLLFMLAVQYKALRIAEELPAEYDRCFTLFRPKRDAVKALKPSTVFDLSLLPERTLFDLFKLSGINASCLTNCKKIVDRRNNEFMHATGNKPTNVDQHISHCLNQLGGIQTCFTTYNDKIAKSWGDELETGEEIPEFVGLRLYQTRLTRADFASGDLERVFSFGL